MTLQFDVLEKITDTAIIASSVNIDKLKDTDYPTIVISDNASIHSLESYQKHKNYFKGSFSTNNIINFAEYNKAQEKYENKHCFISPKKMKAESIFDIGDKEQPGHCRHTAALELDAEVEFKTLMLVTHNLLSQKSLSEFIEDWSDNITCFHDDKGELIELQNKMAIQSVRRVEIKAEASSTSEVGDFESKQSVMESVEARAKSFGDKLPSRIEFKCKPYSDLQERTFVIRIGLLTGEKEPRFSLRIINLGLHEKEMSEEFMSIITENLADTGIKTYIGNFSDK